VRFTNIPGGKDVLTVADFDLDWDNLEILGQGIENVRSNAQQTVLELSGSDGDLINLLGVSGYVPVGYWGSLA
jgi:hypothetical protein